MMRRPSFSPIVLASFTALASPARSFTLKHKLYVSSSNDLISRRAPPASSRYHFSVLNGASDVHPTQGEKQDYFHENHHLSIIEDTVSRVLNAAKSRDILSMPESEREAFGTASNMGARIKSLRRNDDCPRCWMQRYHCICDQCPPVTKPSSIRDIYLLMNHKEICLKMDTAKLIISSFPDSSHFVVGGIGPEYQESMRKMQKALNGENDDGVPCLVLFPDEEATTFSELSSASGQYDLVVLDGTWVQTRKLYNRFIPKEGPIRIQLSKDAVEKLADPASADADGRNSGHQLRRHCTSWRQVGTFEATRIFLKDLCSVEGVPEAEAAWKKMESYQKISNEAVLREMGPPLERSS